MYFVSTFYGRRGAAIQAISGIDIAIWDILGKALNKPIYKLLGGEFRPRVRAYASILMPESPEECFKETRKLCEYKYTAIKLGWGGSEKASNRTWLWWLQRVRLPVLMSI